MLSQQPDGIDGASAPSRQSLSTETIRKLKQDLIQNPETAPSQLGKFNITIGESSEIYIGDTVNHFLDEKSREILIAAIKEVNDSTGGKIYQYLQDFPLEPLAINVDKLGKLNIDLGVVNSLANQGFLTEGQKNAFSQIKQKVHSLNDFNEKLDELYLAARGLLEETKLSLNQRIQELKQKGEELLDLHSLEAIAQEQECRAKELKILEEFISELEDSEKIAQWIDSKRKNLAKRFGRQAIKDFPDISQEADSERISRFCFSVYQFLEQIVHSLKWGRLNILDSPEIPLVFDYSVYERVFILIKEAIDTSIPSRFSKNSKRLAFDCIDYLIEQLPFCNEE